MRIYEAIVKAIIRSIVAWCKVRGRVVHYVHSVDMPLTGNNTEIYLTRYVLSGFMTGDEPQRGWRARLPNIYLHCIHRPDSDDALHNHPWPWGFAIGLLGGYTEQRLPTSWLWGFDDVRSRTRKAPFFNWIGGGDFHRIDETVSFPLAHGSTPMRVTWGTWTLFIAGPRAHAKPWGYLVHGRGFVDPRERHAEIGASEVREQAPARGNDLDAMGVACYGLERKRYLRVFRESDRNYRARLVKSYNRFWAAYDLNEENARGEE